MPLEFNSLEEVPEPMRDEFTQHGDKFVPKDVARLIGEKKQTLDSYHSTKIQLEEVGTKLSDYEKGEVERIKAAQEAAEKKLREEGKFDELIEMERQKAKNLESQYKSKLETTEKQYNELRQSIVQKNNFELARKVASQYAPSTMADQVAELLVSKRIKNLDDSTVFTNASGEAMALDDMELIFQNLEKDPFFKPFAAAPDSRGGMGKGGTHKGDSKTISRAAFAALSPGERAKVAREKKIID